MKSTRDCRILDPDNKRDETPCLRQQGPDAKKLAEYLVMLACSASAAPHVARALMSNGRMAATGLEIATIADRLRRGKTDPKTCPGVEGFTENDALLPILWTAGC